MKKLLLGLGVLVSVLALSVIFGCSKDSAKKSDDIPTIKWIQVGNGMPENYDAWQEHINEYLVEKIGVKVDVEVLSWGDYGTRRSVIINTNEDYDIIFSNHEDFAKDVAIGAYADITDRVKTVAPKLYDFIPESYWKATSMNGILYGVPTYKDSSFTNYYVMVKDYIEKYNVDMQPFMHLSELTPYLEAMKQAEGVNPFPLAWDASNTAGELYDSFGSGISTMGVKYTDETRKVVSVFEQEDVLQELEVRHDWYKKGIINSDAPTLAEGPKWKILGIAQGWSTAAQTVWGPQMDTEVVAVQRSKTVLSNDTVRGSISCINASSPHIDEALKLLEIINTDSYVRDAFWYGLEGDNFDYTEDGRVHRNNFDWPMAGYCQATFFNVTQEDTSTVDQWAEVQKLNEQAIPSVLLGFNFDPVSVEDEIANCYTIWMKYRLQLLTGAQEPRSAVASMMKELRNAGFDDIMAEAQRQIDAAF